MNKTTGYSIWLIPDKKVYNLISKMILDIAKKNHTPKFEPHITLLGEFGETENEKDIIKNLKSIIFNQRPLILNFDSIGYEDFYFRALFLKIKISKELLIFHEKIKYSLNIRNVLNYMPHLSLVYGNLSKKTKIRILSVIKQKFHEKSFIKKLTIKKVLLLKTGGTVKQWRKMATFSLKKT